MPTEPRAKVLYHNKAALMFMDLWQTTTEKERFDRLAKDLGILWVKEDVQEQVEEGETPTTKIPDQVRIPLALNMEGSLLETVRKLFGRKLGILPPSWVKGEEIVEMFDEKPQDFLNFVRTFVRPKVVGTARK